MKGEGLVRAKDDPEVVNIGDQENDGTLNRNREVWEKVYLGGKMMSFVHVKYEMSTGQRPTAGDER